MLKYKIDKTWILKSLIKFLYSIENDEKWWSLLVL